MGKGGGSSSTQSSPWKPVKPLLKDLIGGTQSAYDTGQFNISPYDDPRVADQSGMTQQSLQQFSDIASAGNPFMGQAAGAYEDFMNADPYRDLDTLKENALGDIMPAAMGRFGSSGMLDSSLAADAAGRAATQAIAPFEYGAWNQQQGRKLQALGMAPDLARSSYIDPMMLGQAGRQQDAFAQTNIDADMAKYYEGENQSYDELQRAASLAMGLGGMGSKAKTSEPGGGALGMAGDVMQIAGPLMMMASMAAFSDRRLKTDIHRVGTTDNGLGLYMFRYIYDEPEATMHLGVMADEVEAVNPEAVITRPDGFKMVDYAR